MRKTFFSICKKKGVDQVHCNHAADQRLCFCYIDSVIPLLPKSLIPSQQPSSVAVQFVLDQVAHPENRLPHDTAQTEYFHDSH